MRRFGVLILLLLYSSLAWAQRATTKLSASGSPTAGSGVSMIGTGILYYQLSWHVSGTVSSCTVALDSSADGASWLSGGVIAGQTCTTNGSTSIVGPTSVNYIRINFTALSGSGSVSATVFGDIGSSGATASAIVATTSSPSACSYSTSADPTIVYDGTLYVCGVGDAFVAISGGTGLTSLNGLTAASQSFGTPGTTGTAPSWSSTSSTHTLNIPMASAAGVTAGLLSKTDYDTFNGKQDALGFTAVPNTRTVSTTAPLSGGGALSSNLTLTCAAASGSQAGCLSSADWTTFNGKQAALGYTPVPNTRNVSTTAPIAGGGALSADLTLTCNTASGTQPGCLSTADWTTFNGKQAALGYTPIPNTRLVSTTSPIAGGGQLNADLTLTCNTASGAQAGCLSSTDWNTFNGKQDALGFTAVPNTRSVSTTAPLGGGGALSGNLTLTCAAASGSQAGCLSSTDWTTFNGKQAALTFMGSSPGSKVVTTSLSADPTTDNCVKWIAGGILGDAGASCGSGSMVYPGAGIAVSTGSAWGTSLTAPSGALVGTTDTQTLTGKTVDGVTPTVFGYLDPTSSVQTQLNGKQASLGYTAENVANKNAASGYAPLDSGSKLPAANIPIPTTSLKGGVFMTGDCSASNHVYGINLSTGELKCNADSGGSGATVALDNLSAVAINATLLPGTDNSIDLGSATKQWKNLYFSGSLTSGGSGPPAIEGAPGTCSVSGASNGKLCFSSTGNRPVYSYNAGSNTNVLLASDLASNVFTFLGTPSSSNLASAMTDETGSGSLVFGTAPTLTNPLANTQSSLSASQGSGLYLPGSSLTAGKLYYMSSGGLAQAEANASTTVPAVCLSISTTQCMYSGVFKFSGSQSWTTGQILYVSDASAGAIVTTAPSTSGHYVQRVGVALASDTALIIPSLDVGTIQ